MASPAKKSKDELLNARADFMHAFKKGAEFTEELLQENEKLRYRLAELESRSTGDSGDQGLVTELMEKVRRLEVEHKELVERSAEVEAENQGFASRYVEIEQENNNLLNIYVASYQLHSTLDFDEVLNIITEIILNFVGAEQFAVVMMDEQGTLHPLVVEDLDPEKFRSDETVAAVLATGDAFFKEQLQEDDGRPAACVPLQIKDRTIGAIVIDKFLSQKTELAKVDHELFTLLVGHAATAIFSARLYTDSQRKLSTIQGLIDLVTS